MSSRRPNHPAAPMVARLRRQVSRQTPFSLVSAILPLVVVLVLVADLVLGDPRGLRGATIPWAVLLGIAALVPLLLGARYPAWLGLVAVGGVHGCTMVVLAGADLPQVQLNVVLAFPVVSLYLGWFYPGIGGRLAMLGCLLGLGAAVVVNAAPITPMYSLVTVAGSAALSGLFISEGAQAVRGFGRRRALTDPLTGVFNRRGFLENAVSLRRRARRSGEPVCLAVLDLDGLKALNDREGHDAGDAVLRRVAESWSEIAEMRGLWGRTGGLVGRLGGDEFALLVRGRSEDVASLLRSARSASSDAWSWGLIQLGDGDDLEQALERADGRLYERKRDRS